MRSSIAKVGTAAVLFVVGCGEVPGPTETTPPHPSALPEGVERISGPLLGDPSFGYWGSPTNSIAATIPVCFENPQDFTALTLQNGWTNAPFTTRNAAVMNSGGVIRFAGAIAGGTNVTLFTLPPEFRPPVDTYVPVDLCGAAKGRLVIHASGGAVTVEGSFPSAQCFTSLEGATFALSSVGYSGVVLENGWTSAPFSTRAPQVKNDFGIIRMQGAIAGGTATKAFTLPAGFRPSTMVYVDVDMCGAAQGRVIVFPSGEVDVQAAGAFSDAQCFTSLEGVSFNATVPSTAFTLQNGWTNAPFSTATVGGINKNGLIQLKGAMATAGTNGLAFTLPSEMRPANDVYVPVGLCGGAKGRLVIAAADGSVTVQALGAFSGAQCFTSLEGVSFATNAGNDSVFRGWVRDAVERTWQRYGRLTFSGWRSCIAIGGESGIHVLLETFTDGRVVPILGPDGKGHVGKFALDGRRAQIAPDQGIWLNPNMAEKRARNVAVHEFGHGLGFWHEESRFDAPSQCGNPDGPINNNAAFGNYDTASVMSYCGGQANGEQRLSANDIASVQKVYGRKIQGQIVTPRGNALTIKMWTTGAIGNLPFLGLSDELSTNQAWQWQRLANTAPFAFTQHPDTDPGHTAALTMLNATNGTKVEARDLATASYQWTLDDIELRGFGAKCLTYPGTVGSNLTMTDCASRAVPPTRNANQRWDRLDPNGRLRLTGTNICVAIPNKNGALAGQQLITATCNSTDVAQQFNFGIDAPQITSIKYRANQSFCYDVVGVTDPNFVAGLGGPVEGATIRLATCSATPLLTQDWNVTGQMHALGKCLDRVNGADELFTTFVQTATCTSTANGDFVTNSAAQEWDVYWK